MIDIWNGEIPGYVETDDFAPALENYLLKDKNKDKSVLIFPGGGYTHRSEHEGKDVAEFFNKNGYNAFVLHYRVTPYKFPYPLLDALRAVKHIKSKADEWHLNKNKIIIMGFSAGGHLASMVGTNNDLYRDIYRRELKKHKLNQVSVENENSLVNAQILSYPVISTGEFAHQGSVDNLMGKSSSQKLLEIFSTDKYVCARTASTFIWHTADDASVPVENSLLFCRALSKEKINFESHVFPKGSHGLGLAVENEYVSKWTDLLLEWLNDWI